MTGLVDLNPAHLAIVEHILAEHVPEYEVRAFGSRATWNARDASDLDLAIIGDGPLSSRTLMMLKEAFEESRLPMRVDVIDWNAITDSFRVSIDPDSVVVQEAPERADWSTVALGDVVELTLSSVDKKSKAFRRVVEAEHAVLVDGSGDHHGDTWPIRSIQDMCLRVTSGGTPSRRQPSFYEDGCWPWLKTQELRDGWLDDSEEHITDDAVASSSAKVLPENTVLMAMYGATVGQLGILRRPMTCNQACCAMIVDPGRADYRYLFYQLLHARPWIRNLATGAAQQNLSGRLIKSLKFPFPPLPEQRRIARVLGTLDDKIELNRRMGETLEEMARALFKSWFVDFDPVRAKMEGRDTGLPCHLADLFPDRLVDSEMGEIPAGWEVKTLGDAFRITMGQSPPGKTYNQDGEGLPFYQGRTDFGFRFPGRRVYCTAPTRFAEHGDSLVSVRAPVGDVNMAMEPCSVGRGVASVRHLSGSRSYTYYSMHSLRDTFQRFEAEGTVFGAIGKKGFYSTRWVSPPDRLVAQFDESCSAMDNQIETSEVVTALLVAQRDTLLPRLLSGKMWIAQ